MKFSSSKRKSYEYSWEFSAVWISDNLALSKSGLLRRTFTVRRTIHFTRKTLEVLPKMALSIVTRERLSLSFNWAPPHIIWHCDPPSSHRNKTRERKRFLYAGKRPAERRGESLSFFLRGGGVCEMDRGTRTLSISTARKFSSPLLPPPFFCCSNGGRPLSIFRRKKKKSLSACAWTAILERQTLDDGPQALFSQVGLS